MPREDVPEELVEIAARALCAALEDDPVNDRTDAQIDRDAARAVLSAVSEAGWVRAEDLVHETERSIGNRVDAQAALTERDEARAQLKSAVEYAADAFERAGQEHACDYCRADAATMRRTLENALRAYRSSQESSDAS